MRYFIAVTFLFASIACSAQRAIALERDRLSQGHWSIRGYCDERSVFPAAFRDSLAVIRSLNIYCDSVFALPATIGGMTNLEILTLINCNTLRRLPEEVGRLSRLKNFEARGRAGEGLSELPAAFGELKSLETVAIEGQSLERLPAALTGLPSLARLSLINAPLDSFPVVLAQWKGSLCQLELDASRFRTLPDAVGKTGGAAAKGYLILRNCSLLTAFPAGIAELKLPLYLHGASALRDISALNKLEHDFFLEVNTSPRQWKRMMRTLNDGAHLNLVMDTHMAKKLEKNLRRLKRLQSLALTGDDDPGLIARLRKRLPETKLVVKTIQVPKK